MKTIQDFEKELEKEKIDRALKWFNELNIGPISREQVILAQEGHPYIEWEGYVIRHGYYWKSPITNTYEGFISKICPNCGKFGSKNNLVPLNNGNSIKLNLQEIKELKDRCCFPKIIITQEEKASFWQRIFGTKRASYPIPHSGEENE